MTGNKPTKHLGQYNKLHWLDVDGRLAPVTILSPHVAGRAGVVVIMADVGLQGMERLAFPPAAATPAGVHRMLTGICGVGRVLAAEMASDVRLAVAHRTTTIAANKHPLRVDTAHGRVMVDLDAIGVL